MAAFKNPLIFYEVYFCVTFWAIWKHSSPITINQLWSEAHSACSYTLYSFEVLYKFLRTLGIISNLILLLFNINLFILIGGQLLYNTALVLPYISMNLPRVYTCSPSWTPLPPPSLNYTLRSTKQPNKQTQRKRDQIFG